MTSAANDAQDYYNRARILMHDKKFREAQQCFDRAITINPREPRLYYERGSLLLSLEERKEAMADLNKAIELDPWDYKAYIARARCYDELGNPKAAVDDVSHAMKLMPNARDHYFQMRERSVYYCHLGEFKKAMKDLDDAISCNRKDDFSYKMRADLKFNLKQYQSAIVDYSEAIMLQKPDADYRETYFEQRARAYDKLGQTSLAARDRIKAKQVMEKDKYYELLGSPK